MQSGFVDVEGEAMMARSLELRNAWLPHIAETLEQYLAYDKARPADVPCRRRQLIEDGEPVAAVVALPSYWTGDRTRGFYAAVCRLDQELPRRYQAAVEEAERILREEMGCVSVLLWEMSSRHEAVDTLTSKGYEIKQRNPESKLDLAAFDPSRWQATVDRVLGEGIEFVNFRQLKEEDPDGWMAKVHQMDSQLVVDIPLPEPEEPSEYEQFQQWMWAEEPSWDHHWVARQNGELIAGTRIMRNRINREWGNTGLTGVLRSHRRRGIATALKVHSLGLAKQDGILAVATDNADTNPMYQLNQELGFAPMFEWLAFERSLTA